MKVNLDGLELIRTLKLICDPVETKTNAERAVKALITRRLTNNQYSALVCLVMGIGIDGFKNSGMVSLLNRPFQDGALLAADKFDLYIYLEHDDGERYIDSELKVQREFEKALFLKPELCKRRNYGRKKPV